MPGIDADVRARFGREAAVCGGFGMRGEALGIAEIVGDIRDFQRIEEAPKRPRGRL